MVVGGDEMLVIKEVQSLVHMLLGLTMIGMRESFFFFSSQVFLIPVMTFFPVGPFSFFS